MLHEDEAIADLHHSDDSFGAKTIGSFAGTMLLINNMMGVGIPLLPALFLEAGFVSPIAVIVLMAIFAGYAGSMLAEAMKYIPGNRDFDDRIEYASLCKFYLGKGWYWLIQFLLNMSLLSLNLVSILLTVQVMDWTIIAIFKCTYGLVLLPAGCEGFGFQSVCLEAASVTSHANSPFGNAMVISLGFVVSIILVIPMGYFNLEDNMGIQVVSTAIQTLILFQWFVTFFRRGFSFDGVRAFGSGEGQGSVLGQVVLNYAYVMTVPSWANEKRRSSNVNKCVWWAVGSSSFFFLSIGILGALSFPDLGPGEDILTALNRENASILDQISVYLFPLIAVASSIPVFSIIVRYNLMENGIFGKLAANIFSVVLPWVIAVPLTAGNTIFNAVATYSSILFVLPINFVVPFVIYIAAMRRRRYLKPCYCEPGPCKHDDPASSIGLDDSVNGGSPTLENELRAPNEKDPLLSNGILSGDEVLTHRHVLSESGHVYREEQVVKRELWSEKNPRCARCCSRGFVAWLDKPSVSPLAPFSLRHPRLAKCLPYRLVAWLDIPDPPAPEHFALPVWFRTFAKQAIAMTMFVLTMMLLVFSLGLAIWQTVDPLDTLNGTAIGLNMTGHNGTKAACIL